MAKIIGRPIAYAGLEPNRFEQNMATFMPKWTMFEMCLMTERYVSAGMIPEDGDVERLVEILGFRCRGERWDHRRSEVIP